MAPAVDSEAESGTDRVVNLTDSLPTTKKKKQQQQQKGGVVRGSDENECAISPIVVLKKKCDMRRYEKSEECFILDFDPFEMTPVKNGVKQIDEDVAVISEKGQVACRDYPHSRHLCLEFPFDKTLHESYCKLCYCYVCDTAAPCEFWKLSLPVLSHCHASDRIDEWKRKRASTKKTAKASS